MYNNTSSNNPALQEAFRNWDLSDKVKDFNNPIGVTLTFDFSGITREKAIETMKDFLNYLNRNVFRNAYRRFNKQVRVLPIIIIFFWLKNILSKPTKDYLSLF